MEFNEIKNDNTSINRCYYIQYRFYMDDWAKLYVYIIIDIIVWWPRKTQSNFCSTKSSGGRVDKVFLDQHTNHKLWDNIVRLSTQKFKTNLINKENCNDTSICLLDFCCIARYTITDVQYRSHAWNPKVLNINISQIIIRNHRKVHVKHM